MKRLLPRRTPPMPPAEHAYKVAALRLQLLVAMAGADGRILPPEVDVIGRTIDRCGLDAESKQRLEQLLRILLESPPQIEQVVERIAEHAPKPKIAEALVREMFKVARSDDVKDDREEALLRLTCGALGVEPTSLFGLRARPLDRRERAQLDAMLADVAS